MKINTLIDVVLLSNCTFAYLIRFHGLKIPTQPKLDSEHRSNIGLINFRMYLLCLQKKNPQMPWLSCHTYYRTARCQGISTQIFRLVIRFLRLFWQVFAETLNKILFRQFTWPGRDENWILLDRKRRTHPESSAAGQKPSTVRHTQLLLKNLACNLT